jgi:hypothetical protein
MSGYAVVWRTVGGRRVSGRLELASEGVWLSGGSRDAQVTVEIPYDEIVAAQREPVAGSGSSRLIRLDSRAAGSLLLASLDGPGVLGEILAALQQALA